MSTYTTLIATLVVSSLCAPALASHANLWMDDEDKVLIQFHDVNQEQSLSAPGEDEMRGAMTRKAHGKTSGIASESSGLGDGSQAAAASGGRSGGQNGNANGNGNGDANGNGGGGGSGNGGGRGKQ